MNYRPKYLTRNPNNSREEIQRLMHTLDDLQTDAMFCRRFQCFDWWKMIQTLIAPLLVSQSCAGGDVILYHYIYSIYQREELSNEETMIANELDMFTVRIHLCRNVYIAWIFAENWIAHLTSPRNVNMLNKLNWIQNAHWLSARSWDWYYWRFVYRHNVMRS